MADIRLVYFDARGRAEFIRLLLHAAGQPFDDIRVTRTQWQTAQGKADSPFGQLPYLIYLGKKSGQSLAIANFLARKLGFYGSSAEDGLRIDEVCQLSNDMRTDIRKWRTAADQQKQEEPFSRYFGYFERLLQENGSSGYFVGDSLSLADLIIYDILDTVINLTPEDQLSFFPCLQKLRTRVKSYPSLREYLSKRAEPSS